MIKTPDDFRDRCFELAASEDDPYKVVAQVFAEVTDPSEWKVIAQVTAFSWVAHTLRTSLPKPQPRPQRTYRDSRGNVRASAREVGQLTEWERRCALKVYVDGAHKTLGACTAADLEWLASYREIIASDNVAAAVRYRKLRDSVLAQGVMHVAELHSDVGLKVLKNAA